MATATDLIDQHAREKAKQLPEWGVFRYEQLPEAKGILLTGAIAPPYKSGPRKGTPNWKARDAATERRVFITHAEQEAYAAAWEQSTGQCSRCQGAGDIPWSWSKAEGSKRKPCPKCQGTGEARVAIEAGATA